VRSAALGKLPQPARGGRYFSIYVADLESEERRLRSRREPLQQKNLGANGFSVTDERRSLFSLSNGQSPRYHKWIVENYKIRSAKTFLRYYEKIAGGAGARVVGCIPRINSGGRLQDRKNSHVQFGISRLTPSDYILKNARKQSVYRTRTELADS